MIRKFRPLLVGLIGLGLVTSASAGAATKTTKKAAKTTKRAVTTKATTPASTAPATTAPASTAATPAPPTTAARNTASDVGVTADTIKVAVIAADLTGLIRFGVIRGVPEDTHIRVGRRYQYYFDKWNAAGGINGRKIEATLVTWDPADPRTFDRVCQRINLDLKPFMVLQPGGGFRADATECIAGTGNTPFIGIDAVGLDTFKNSKGNLYTLAAPSEISASAGTELAVKSGAIPRDAKVGVLRGNLSNQVDAYARAKKVLDDAGIKIAFDDVVNTATTDAGTAANLVRLTVPKMQDAGVTHVLVMLPFTNSVVFPPEARRSGFNPKYAMVDISSGMCTAFSGGQGGPELDGATCATQWDMFHLDDKGVVRQDSAFEAQCRKEYDEMNNFKSQYGVPYGGATDVDSRRLIEDSPGLECTWANVVRDALTKAGSNLTRKTFNDAMATMRDFPVANMSNGKGSLSADKPFAATAFQSVRFTVGDARASALGGLYGKCLVPANCFRTAAPQVWSPITQNLKG